MIAAQRDRSFYHAPCLGLLTLLGVVHAASAGQRQNSSDRGEEGVKIITLSSLPDRVSGGDALVEITMPRASTLIARLNKEDVTRWFHADPKAPNADRRVLIGLVQGLKIGSNRFEASTSDGDHGSLTLVNYPIQGPIVSGPHIQPFICQTDIFPLPDGSTLGPARDRQCSADTRVSYVYLPVGAKTLKPLPSLSHLPADVAQTTTTTGTHVPLVVRVETATINRGIYQSAILHDPTIDPPPGPLSPPIGWNRILIGIHGAGCTGGWHTQAGTQVMLRAMSDWLLDPHWLGQGYALYTNTLQNPSNSCNPFLAGETAMMGKEHFIKTYGVPRYSLSTGGSGGAYTTLQIIDAFPGVFDGALIDSTFPDALSIALSGMDGHLLTHYFTAIDPSGFTEAQQVAVSGYKDRQAWYDAANQAGRTDPVPNRNDVEGYRSGVWNDAVPENLRYDPKRNRCGARPTIWDAARNIYGVDPATGAALRVFDNVGVQYGLAALNAGNISKRQFLDLNQKIGGYDRDDNYVPVRTIADGWAIAQAYRSGMQLSGHGGLANVPIVDLSGTMNESAGYHYQWFHFAVRERLRDANGDSGNFIMWRGGGPDGSKSQQEVSEDAFDLVNEWIAAVRADNSEISTHEKVILHKPSSLVEGCWPATAHGRFIAEPQVFGAQPNTQCNALWPSHSFPRLVAGGPLAANVLKCELKPIDFRDYAVTFDAKEVHRLREVFPRGVCDWSKPGVGFQGIVVGVSYRQGSVRYLQKRIRAVQ